MLLSNDVMSSEAIDCLLALPDCDGFSIMLDVYI